MTEVRTRFAPSPTGFLHIGGARTAIFNWLFARRHGGSFILRIEDTDQERSTEESIDQILEAMKWLNIDFDEGPFRQTERSGIYQKNIDQLLEQGDAYRCVCSKEELDAKRQAVMKAGGKPKYDGTCRQRGIGADCDAPFVIRFKSPETGKTLINDLLRGTISFDNAEIDDMIIARSDGTPTYNFCVVVDDSDMRITHVIRGDDHLSNTPRQVVIYNALGQKVPAFAHVSMILGKDGGRLSKRHGALSVLDYHEKGILPDAFVNYMVRLGWSHGDQEVFTIKELKELFDLDSVSKSASRFDEEKMVWLNSEYIKTVADEELSPLVTERLNSDGISCKESQVTPLLAMLKPRNRTLIELAKSASCFLVETVEFEEKAAKKFLKPETSTLLEELADNLEKVDFSDESAIEVAFTALLESHELKLKVLAQPVRVCLTGGTVSPGLFEVMAKLGKERSVMRIRTGAAHCATNS